MSRRAIGTLLCAAVLVGAGAPALAQPSAPASAVASPAIDLMRRIAELEHEGDSRPRKAADTLAGMESATGPFSAERLELLTVRGLLLAMASEPEAAEQIAQALDDWGRVRDTPDALAAALLVRARALAQRGNLRRPTRWSPKAWRA